MSDNSNGSGGEDDRADRQLENDPQVGAKVAPDGEIGSGQQQWGQEKHQGQVRIELDVRCAGNQRQRDAAEDEGCGRRHAQAAREQLQRDDRGQQQENELEARDGAQVDLPQ